MPVTKELGINLSETPFRMKVNTNRTLPLHVSIKTGFSYPEIRVTG